MTTDQTSIITQWGATVQATQLPTVVLPSRDVTITHTATQLFGLIAESNTMFVRGNAVMRATNCPDGRLALEILRPSTARSSFEKHATFFAWRKGANNEDVMKPTTCSHDMAVALLNSEEAAFTLRHVDGIVNCPILRPVGGELSVAAKGYDRHTRLLIAAGDIPPRVDLAEAVPEILGLFNEFDFQSPGDKARAIASLLTPALKMGGLIKGRVPVDVAEADESQAGKGYRQRLIAAVYNENISMITQREGGVGSWDESFSQALISGRPFIQFDNCRGRLSSPHLEAFLTAEHTFACRVPYQAEVSIRADGFFVFLTSNGVDTTRDLANRSSIIRIKKKPPGFAFAQFSEGDLLDHVRGNPAWYLACVFAVIREWYRQGQPRTGETCHDFRPWVQALDWICQNVFKTVPVMDGHAQAKERVSNSSLVWLRAVVLAIQDSGPLGQALTATDLHVLCETSNIQIPGLSSCADPDKAKRIIGTIMARLFRDCGSGVLEVDACEVKRGETLLPRANTNDGGRSKGYTYTITRR